MSMEDLEEPWGLLVSYEGEGTEEEGERIPLVGRTITIGRGKDSEIALADNQFVSTSHCTILRGEDGSTWIRDTSTNGTLLNGQRLRWSKEVKLSTGDVIWVVHKKETPDCNVGYRFYNLRSSQPLEATLPFESSEGGAEAGGAEEGEERGTPEEGGAATPTAMESKKRPLEEKSEAVPGTKRLATEEAVKKAVGRGGELAVESTGREPGEEVKEGGEGGTEGGNPEGKAVAQPFPAKPEMTKKDSMEETLLCGICQEIMHDCVSLQPCMHSYCAGCYSEWMGHSNTCPACRNKVDRISRNHIVNNLAEAYLRANPSKKRSEEDIKELDGKNKITKDMLYPKRRRRCYDDDDDDEYSSGSEDSGSPFPPPFPLPLPFTGFPPMFHSLHTPAPLFVCRQCPSYVDVGAPPPSSHPAPPPFTCTPTTNHVLCMCCLQPMPDRRHDSDMSIPPQKCDICGQAYCHMYWGCRRLGCRGCLGLFKDMDFDEACLSSIINNGNRQESQILKDYLQSKGITLKDMLEVCCGKLDGGDYHCTDSRTARLSSSTRTCHKCAMRNLQDLVYLYRRDIPNDDLPAEVTRRPDCYWGRNCRTQRNKPHHAERFNHMCEQTRRS